MISRTLTSDKKLGLGPSLPLGQTEEQFSSVVGVMQEHMYNQLSDVEDRHWWNQSRLGIAAYYVKKMNLPPGATIVDVGCGTGGTTRFLEQYGHVKGVDRSDFALRYAAEKVENAELISACNER